jgi:hypothetical protein
MTYSCLLKKKIVVLTCQILELITRLIWQAKLLLMESYVAQGTRYFILTVLDSGKSELKSKPAGRTSRGVPTWAMTSRRSRIHGLRLDWNTKEGDTGHRTESLKRLVQFQIVKRPHWRPANQGKSRSCCVALVIKNTWSERRPERHWRAGIWKKQKSFVSGVKFCLDLDSEGTKHNHLLEKVRCRSLFFAPEKRINLKHKKRRRAVRLKLLHSTCFLVVWRADGPDQWTWDYSKPRRSEEISWPHNRVESTVTI